VVRVLRQVGVGGVAATGGGAQVGKGGVGGGGGRGVRGYKDIALQVVIL
jgi:hypothetical protein